MIKEFRNISIYNKRISNRYYADNTGSIYSVLNSKSVKKRVGDKTSSKSFLKEYKKELKNMQENGLSYTRISVDGYNQYIIVLNDGTVMKRLSTKSENGKHIVINLNNFNGVRHSNELHQLINICFNESPNIDETIHHIDLDKQNNNADNLLIMKKTDHTAYHSFLRNNNNEMAKKILSKYIK